MSDEVLDIILQQADSQASSQEGHARELLASAQNQRMLAAALRHVIKENKQLKSQQPIINNNFTFKAPVGQAIGNVEHLESSCQPSPSQTTSMPRLDSTSTTSKK